MKRSSRLLAVLVISVMAMLALPLLSGTANAAPPQDGVYQIYRPIISKSTWTVTLATVTAVDNTLGVTVIYQNNSASGQGLYCPNTKQSMLVNGQTVVIVVAALQHVGADVGEEPFHLVEPAGIGGPHPGRTPPPIGGTRTRLTLRS